MWIVIAILPNGKATQLLEFRTEKQAWEWIFGQESPELYEVWKKRGAGIPAVGAETVDMENWIVR